jgi:hypothetical protein
MDASTHGGAKQDAVTSALAGRPRAGRARRIILRLWPASLAGRTAVTLLAGFAAVQLIGLGIHTVNQITLNHIATERNIATRDIELYRQIASAKPAARATLIASQRRKGEKVRLSDARQAPPQRHRHARPHRAARRGARLPAAR